MKKLSWRELFKVGKSEQFKDDFKNYKVPGTKTELPNRANFSGDKFPSSGDPAKIELNNWHSGNSVYQRDKKVEKSNSDIPSPVTQEKNKRESVGNETVERKSALRMRKALYADVSFQQKPDGAVSIDVTNEQAPETLETEAPTTDDMGATENNVTSKWRSVFKTAADADIDFKKDPDGTMSLKVQHVNKNETEEIPGEQQPSTQYPQAPETGSPSLPQESSPGMVVNTASLEDCTKAHKNMKERIIRQEGNLLLIARECEDKVGVFIEKKKQGLAGLNRNNSYKTIDQEIKERNGKQWGELINQAVWEHKFEQLLKNG